MESAHVTAASAGSAIRSSSRRMKKLRAEFFEEGRAASRSVDPATVASSFCWLCGEAIDYTIPAGSAPYAHELDHFYPVSTHPELQEDPANFRHSHQLCNQQRGAGSPSVDLGEQVAPWWV